MLKKAIPGLASIGLALLLGFLAIETIQQDPATWRLVLVIISVSCLSAMGGAFAVAGVARATHEASTDSSSASARGE
ncbi:hypothetical protein [Actinomyces vulturis]|uniref:hypothetical protein n=1 Tax=Actinomyces vulturis TaxID=1857645 RepID=UPI000837228A|nr:hypothetical protein [Actinomyces vulturis]